MCSQAEVTRLFGETMRVQRMLDVEVALARAEAAAGIIPAGAAAAIANVAEVSRFDLDALRDGAGTAGNLAIPLVKALTKLVATNDERASHFVHWGATSQDIIDTGLVLQLREAVPIVVRDLRRAIAAATGHATRHARTTMPGRTWLQQATPITFGLKAAGWLDALSRVTASLESALENALVLQFGGASGTLAALGADGLNVSARLAPCSICRVPPAPWHAHRDRLAALACALGVTCGTMGKTARDLALLGQTELQEAIEAAGKAGGSSTMPHKRNPVRASRILASALRAPGLVATMLSAMPQEHERGLGGWQAEWEVLPELVILTAAAASATAEVLEDLEVRPEAMAKDFAATNGLTMAESVAMALAAHIGKPEAHRLVEQAATQAVERGVSFAEALAANPNVTRHLDRGAIEDALVAEDYLGVSAQFIGRVLAASASRTPHE